MSVDNEAPARTGPTWTPRSPGSAGREKRRPARWHVPLSPRDFYILFALADEDRHGYGLVKVIEEQSNGALRLDPANLYRAVQKLANAGLVADADRRRAPDVADERRRYYRLTDLGRRVVIAEAERMRHLVEAATAKRLISPSGGVS